MFLYDRATAIDRSTPETVVSQFLHSALVMKDPAKTSLFTCRSWPVEDAMAQVGPTDPDMVITWGDFDVQRDGARSTVRVSVQFTVPVGTSFAADVQRWRFELEDQAGWRVCALAKEGSVNP